MWRSETWCMKNSTHYHINLCNVSSWELVIIIKLERLNVTPHALPRPAHQIRLAQITFFTSSVFDFKMFEWCTINQIIEFKCWSSQNCDDSILDTNMTEHDICGFKGLKMYVSKKKYVKAWPQHPITWSMGLLSNI